MSRHPSKPGPTRALAMRAFTLIELLVVLAVMALLLTIATPRYVDHVERAKEATLKTSLKTMRDAIDEFAGEQGRAPESLDELATRHYLKAVPVDPVTDRSDTWITVSPAEMPGAASDAANTGVADVRSGAPGNGRDGTAFRDW
ncbi:MAG TPA: type II secretion system protein [Burkholderiaceae bacterium]|nr:type II secretion system protein [Burkholderiaceae bacterium]